MPEEVDNNLGVLDTGSSDNNSDMGESGGSDESGNSQDQTMDAIAALTKQVEGLTSLSGKVGRELGEVRNYMNQQTQPQNNVSEGAAGEGNDPFDQLLSDPDAWVKNKFSEMSKHQADSNQRQITETREILRSHDPEAEQYNDEMINILSKDTGMDKSQVATEMHRLGAPTLVNVLERAKANKKLEQMEKLVEAMKQGGGDIDAAKRALMKTPSSGESFQPPSSADVPKVNVRNMDDNALAKLYKERIKKQ